jgi:exopolyphosphatase/pppGpp-phosphohydrolase
MGNQTETESKPLAAILEQHGGRLQIHAVRGSSYKTMAEDLMATLEMERSRTAAVLSNLNAILNQYQVTAQSVKQLQNSQDETIKRLQQGMLELQARENDETDRQGK